MLRPLKNFKSFSVIFWRAKKLRYLTFSKKFFYLLLTISDSFQKFYEDWLQSRLLVYFKSMMLISIIMITTERFHHDILWLGPCEFLAEHYIGFQKFSSKMLRRPKKLPCYRNGLFYFNRTLAQRLGSVVCTPSHELCGMKLCNMICIVHEMEANML